MVADAIAAQIDHRPDWAAELGVSGIDTDPAMLCQMGVELRGNMSFDQVIPFGSRAKFCPVIHRPLFNHLGIVTNRTFETFCSDTIPLLMLPSQMIESIYGPAARVLAVGDDVACHIQRRTVGDRGEVAATLARRGCLCGSCL